MKGMEWIFRELVENSDDIYVLVDKNFHIRYISSVVRKYGADPLSLLGKNIFDFAENEKADALRECLSSGSGKKIFETGLRLTADEITYFDVTAYPIRQDNEDGGQVLQLHDVTPYKKKTQELLSSNKQLDQVIYKTTHDLRAPVMSALGLLTLAEQAPEPQRLEYLALIRRSLNKLNAFIEDMHQFYRTGKMAIQRQLISWEEVIREELDNHRMTYHPDKVSIEVHIDHPVAFCSDLIRVKTILTNLLTNAIKYADVRKPRHFIRIDVKVTEKQAVLKVADNGIGIEPQYHERIFDMFFRATTQAQGSGLGLFILRDTVERLKGKIELQSVPGEGSTFIVYLPNQRCEEDEAVEDTRAGSRSFS